MSSISDSLDLNYHKVLFLLCIDNISKSDQVLCVLPSKWFCTDEVAKICIAKSKYMHVSFSLYICLLLFLPKLVLFFSFLKLIILRSQFLLVNVSESHLRHILTLLFLFLFQEYSSSLTIEGKNIRQLICHQLLQEFLSFASMKQCYTPNGNVMILSKRSFKNQLQFNSTWCFWYKHE